MSGKKIVENKRKKWINMGCFGGRNRHLQDVQWKKQTKKGSFGKKIWTKTGGKK